MFNPVRDLTLASFVLIAAVSTAGTAQAQQRGGGFRALDRAPIVVRPPIANRIVVVPIPGQSKPPRQDRPPGKPPRDEGAGNDRPSRPPRRPPIVVIADPPRVVCRGGEVVSGACVCPKGSTRVRATSSGFTCRTNVAEPPRRKAPPAVIVAPVAAAAPLASRARAEPPPAPPPGGTLPPPSRAVPAAVQRTQVPDEILVTLPIRAPNMPGAALARRFNLVELERVELELTGTQIVRYRIPDRRSVSAVLAAMAGDPQAAIRQPNYIYRRQQALTEAAAAKAPLQYALQKVHAPQVHATTLGAGVLIAVLDTEVDAAHPDLAAVSIARVDAAGQSRSDDATHGTAIAGIIAGRGLVKGVAPEAQLLAIRTLADRNGVMETTSFVLLRALERAAKESARVINLSLAGPRDEAVHTMLKAAVARGIVIVAAAGNNGPKAAPAYPAAYAQTIAVTATDARDALYGAANRGRYIAVAAPGVDVLVPVGGGAHDIQTGTSFAAAHVSGVVALMISRLPSLTPAEVRAALIAGAADLGPPGIDEEFGAGLADAEASLAFAGKSARTAQ